MGWAGLLQRNVLREQTEPKIPVLGRLPPRGPAQGMLGVTTWFSSSIVRFPAASDDDDGFSWCCEPSGANRVVK